MGSVTAGLLAAVLAGHLIGDWIVQTDRMASGKVRPGPDAVWWERWDSWAWNQAHVATYHLTLALCVVAIWHSWAALIALGVSWVSHSFIDRRWPVRWLMVRTGSDKFVETSWGPMVVDQALHLSILCLLVAYLGQS